MSKSDNPYQYEALEFPKYQFRTLRLLPDALERGIVRCELEVDSLLKPASYVGLSYCWGPPDVTADIILNGQVFPATTNLEAALRRLRANGVERLWIDALCINQKDYPEKGLQLMRMGLIYAKAASVLVWLGEEEDSSGLALSIIEGRSNPSLPDSRPFTNACQFAVSALMNRPYWRRIWIIQEIAKARLVTVQCGNLQISWVDLKTGLENLIKEVSTAVVSLAPYEVEVFSVLNEFYNREKAGGHIPLSDAMVASRLSLSSVPRDKAFALLGLSKDGVDMFPTPNYVESDAEILMEMSKYVIHTYPEKLCSIFLGDASRLENTTTPSWLPSWFDLPAELPDWVMRSKIHAGTWTDRTPPMYITWPTDCSSVSLEYPVLGTWAQVIGVIDGLSAVSSSPPPSGSGFPKHQPAYMCGRQALPLDKFNATCVLEMLFKTLRLTMKTSYHTKDHSKKTKAFADLLCGRKIRYTLSKDTGPALNFDPIVQNWVATHQDWIVFGHPLREWASALAPSSLANFLPSMYRHNEFHKGTLQRWANNLKLVLEHGMRVFVTQQGTTGLAPRASQPGDVICILSGCVAALRPFNDGYRLVGQAFVELENLAFEYANEPPHQSFTTTPSKEEKALITSQASRFWVLSPKKDFEERKLEYTAIKIY